MNIANNRLKEGNPQRIFATGEWLQLGHFLGRLRLSIRFVG